jgi:signal transduction histidine kinase
VPGDTTEGSGLGLAVVHEIAEQLGGRVRLQNREDRSGLIARVWLPRLILEQSDADREPS